MTLIALQNQIMHYNMHIHVGSEERVKVVVHGMVPAKEVVSLSCVPLSLIHPSLALCHYIVHRSAFTLHMKRM